MSIKCGVKGSSGRPCQKAAGWGTDHVGIGPCKYHEDSEDRPVAGRHAPLVQMLDPDKRPMIVNMLSDDQQLFDMRYEIAVLRDRFARSANMADSKELADLAKSTIAVMSKLREMEVGKHYYIHVNVIGLVLQAVGEVSRQYVPENRRDMFANDLTTAIRRLLPQSTTSGIATSALVEPISVEICQGDD